MRKHITKTIKVIPPWIFLILAVASGFFAVSQLRANNQQMISLRQEVYEADKSNGDVQTSLQDLQAYVTRHMNTNLQSGATGVYPPVQLKYTYERLVKAKSEDAQKSNSEIYSDAQTFCEQQNAKDVSGRNRIPCIQQYVSSHSSTSVKTIPDALYKFDFVSPRWSPDSAGWSLLFASMLGILFIISFIYHRLVTHHWV